MANSSSSSTFKVILGLVIAGISWLVLNYKKGASDNTATTGNVTNNTSTTSDAKQDKSGTITLSNYLPSVTGRNQVIKHQYYTLSFDDKAKVAEWVAYTLTAEHVQGAHEPRSGNFRPDPDCPNGSATPNDYRATGYDRGHLAPASDMSFNPDAMSESFFMSNMTPQLPEFNRGIWKELEEQVRDYATKCTEIYVVTGPILPHNTSGVIGASKVAVPKSFYKVILDLYGPHHKGIAFIIPNEGESGRPLSDFVVPISQVEAKTGINFFPALSADIQKKLESTADINEWGIDESRSQERISNYNKRGSSK